MASNSKHPNWMENSQAFYLSMHFYQWKGTSPTNAKLFIAQSGYNYKNVNGWSRNPPEALVVVKHHKKFRNFGVLGWNIHWPQNTICFGSKRLYTGDSFPAALLEFPWWKKIIAFFRRSSFFCVWKMLRIYSGIIAVYVVRYTDGRLVIANTAAYGLSNGIEKTHTKRSSGCHRHTTTTPKYKPQRPWTG